MSVVCPLCNQTFSKGNIEAHASSCNGPLGESNKPNIVTMTSKRKLDPLNQVEERKSPKAPKLASLFSTKQKEGQESLKTPKLASLFPTKQVFSNIASLPLKVAEAKSEEMTTPMPKKIVEKPGAPLAERMRPSDFTEYCGQAASLGPNTWLRNLLSNTNNIPSLILWGPPGCGKTSLANIIALKVKGTARFVKMSACTCGVAEVREVVKQAKSELTMFKRKTVLFMDEVHRFNKTQQDSFLPHIENGTIVFIGATTENPSFSLNNALLSRCKVVTLEKLDKNSVRNILMSALDKESVVVGNEGDDVSIAKEALDYLATVTDGDARAALNNLELVLNNTRAEDGSRHIEVSEVAAAVARAAVTYDKTGEQHYHMASALQKSIRGSDDNAALYWLGRMLRGGEDPLFIARRLVRCASEDVGLADNAALTLAVSAMQGTQLLGRPECDVLLAQCTTYLARAKKSHEVYGALGEVYRVIDNPGEGGLPGVPLHLRSSGGKVGRDLGWGDGYSHDLGRVASFKYLPPELQGRNFFKDGSY